MFTCNSPWLFAAYRVLRRQSVPWHPPCALLRLILPRLLPSKFPLPIPLFRDRLAMLTLLRLLRGKHSLIYEPVLARASDWNPGSSLKQFSECLPCAVFKVRILRSRFREPSKRYRASRLSDILSVLRFRSTSAQLPFNFRLSSPAVSEDFVSFVFRST